MADRTVTVEGGGGGDYSTLNGALSGESADLVTLQRILTIECYASASPDSTKVNFGTGYQTSTTYYIKVTVPPGERHAGVYDSSKYRLTYSFNGNNDTLLTIGNNTGTIIEFVQFAGSCSDTWNIHVYISHDYSPGTFKLIVRNCIFKSAGGEGNREYGVVIYSNLGTGSDGGFVYNNLFMDLINESASVGVRNGSGTGTEFIFNNTFVNCANGVYSSNNYRVKLNNNLFSGCTGVCNDTIIVAGSGYNSTNLASLGYTVDGGATGDRVSQTFTFKGASDFHLASTDTGALGYGINLYNDANLAFQNDIDGQDRGGSGATWDIGADEYILGDPTILKYKTAATEAGLSSASWTEVPESGQVESDGWMKLRAEVPA